MEFTEEEVDVAVAIALNNYKHSGVVMAFEAATIAVVSCEDKDHAVKWMQGTTAGIRKLVKEELHKICNMPGYKTYAEKLNRI